MDLFSFSVDRCFGFAYNIHMEGEIDMKIYEAMIADLPSVKNIVHTAINDIYPHYYPVGAVEFFLAHHCDENIIKDITAGNVFLLSDRNGKPVGTGSVVHNEITRLFVLPEYQGKGYGGMLIRFAEERIAESFDSIIIDASFSAKQIYLKKGYVPVKYNTIKCNGGDYLCYDVMIKKLR